LSNKQGPKDPFQIALALLARRSYSVAELRRALKKKFPDAADEISNAVARLRQLGYLDDKKLAENYALSIARNRSFGRYRVRRELRGKLLKDSDVDAAVEKTFASVDERELLARAVEKKIRTIRKPVTRARLASLCQSLVRRGFCADDIMRELRARPELQTRAEEVDLQAFEAGEEETEGGTK